jgi:pyridoxal phosphate-dependent aminotransferase EpsN
MKLAQKRIYLSPPHMTGNEQTYLKQAFASNWIAPLGPHVDRFEADIEKYIHVKKALAVNSGTAAIHLALRLIGITAGDIVFCSSLTFVASANPILYEGAKPVFIDSEPDTWNMCPQSLRKALKKAAFIGKLPKAVIVVNLYGQSAKMDELLSICKEYDVPVVEDAAESLGSTYKGKMSGSFGDYGVFSFNGNKIITTSGGGMLVSNDIESIEKARFLSTQARDQALHYQHSEKGYNYRMSNLLAGIGVAQLEVIENRVQKKRRIFRTYEDELGYLDGLSFMKEYEGSRHNRWLTTLTIEEEKIGLPPWKVIEALELENIEARPVWKPLHLQPLFKECDFYQVADGTSISEDLFRKGICLPSGTGMTVEEQMRVIQVMKDAVEVKRPTLATK